MSQVVPLHRGWLLAIKERNDKDAFGAVYRVYWEELYNHALRRVRNEQQAEDLVQELFIQLWEQRERLDTMMNLPAYLYGMLKYKIIDFFNSNKVKPQLLDLWATDLHHYVQQNPDELEAYYALERLLDRELDSMPLNMKQAILLKWDKLSIRDIAVQLGLSEQTVKNNISVGSKRLQHALLVNNSDAYSTLAVLATQSLTLLLAY
ncbi:sigma-70 family RNA polymerase sigma factor [Sphingobacterium alkalisoli]|uniref:Sigma-70 family RNA polymerase sigma factor n=1 Tax=Sphingobacterium alkalisoli TaxID=1874115 RepID=A0A4U0H2W9_9SPHI|nr:sigma-70 family RNA polymerase sigma factor [Sphingobacterium alkalisoli]TJY66007.1 sigma-70 family RNA polymerase sigma factor [Sphingobacterium alkalisoli]GGH16859.1 DNA-directed RNA polymerase sigma-70 factor [Sphingobacterium alkalisoli]